MIYLIAILISPLTVALRGLVLCKLWHWFIVPQFGLSDLRIPHALGLALIVSFLTHQDIDTQPESKDSNEKMMRSMAVAILSPLFALTFGWIFTLFI